MRFAYHNCGKIEEADVVLFGVPDESGSYANRKGTSKGPDAIRKVSLDRLRFVRKDGIHKLVPERGTLKLKLFDAGDIKKKNISNFINAINKKQFPILLGGDHSNTYLTLEALQKNYSDILVLYLDAHPDMVSSMHENYYGSVAYDISKLKNVKKIIEVGVRSIEAEELENLKRKKVTSFTALDFYELGVKNVFSKIKTLVGKTPLYLSIDLDVIDPAFAPGVDTPSAFGLMPDQFLYLIKNCASSLNLIGFDIMELSPKYDIQQRTSQLAAQTIIEILGSKK